VTKRLKIALLIAAAVALWDQVMHVCGLCHALFTLTLGTQGMGTQVHGPYSLPPPAVATPGSCAAAFVDRRVTHLAQWPAH
jgi:hypothetical protein